MVKICGLTRPEDVALAISLGANAVGFIFAPSPRRISPEAARALAATVPLGVLIVGIFVDETPEEIARIARFAGLTAVQLHGEESPAACESVKRLLPECRLIKAFRILGAIEVPPEFRIADFFLFDLAEGVSLPADFFRRQARPSLLAGGLTVENTCASRTRYGPAGVDLARGVESRPGTKDHSKLRRFFRNLGAKP